ncbi:MAG: hypothetical protein DWQ02_23530 [Bacteroidetes bacterium]|nr:MAG: hypothetical protein DWQ02_23530 [Bacteroidota bacterium]
MQKILPALVFSTIIFLLVDLTSCTHDVIFDDDITMPVDTMDVEPPIDTMGIPCDPEVVYFEYEVLPLLISNCAVSGCHNAAGQQGGVILDSYQNLINTTDFEPYDLEGTDIYEVITEDGDDIMPPAPGNPLTSEQITLIATWILQGGQDLECDWEGEECDLTNVGYADVITPIISTYCLGCHSGANPGGGYDLSTHAGVQEVALSGQLFGAVNWDAGYVAMPQGGNQLSACEIDQIESWIEAGALNN